MDYIDNAYKVGGESQRKLLAYMDDVIDHPVFDNHYFRFLRDNKFTASIYALHRVNFYYRTMATVIGIAHICAHAALNHDKDTLIYFLIYTE